jgi:hypothetical protein
MNKKRDQGDHKHHNTANRIKEKGPMNCEITKDHPCAKRHMDGEVNRIET